MKFLLAYTALFFCSFCFADNRRLDFEDNFDDRAELGSGYVPSISSDGAWTFKEGILVGTQTRSDHGSVMRKQLAFRNIDIEVDFRLNGGTRFNFVIGDKNEKSTHAGHICRVSLKPPRVNVSDDKTGIYNLDIRAMRLDPNLSDKKKEWLATFLKDKNDAGQFDIKQGEWYRLRVRIKNDLMEAYIDGELIASVQSPGIAHPTKTQFGMTVNGSTIDFDNMKVYDVER